MPIQKVDKIWMDGRLVNWDDATIHILTHTLHYGSGVFEGIRAYSTTEGPAVFRLTDHIRRLLQSAKMLMIESPFSVEQLVEATKETVRVNNVESCYIRPLIYLGYGEMGLNPLPCAVNVSIAVWPWGTYLGEEGIKHGVRMKVSSWRRQDPNMIPPAAKVTGLYVNSSLAKVDALKAGYDEAILLNSQGHVSECTGENLFVVRGGRIITPPLSAGGLDGITPDSIMVVAPDLGEEGTEEKLLRSDLYVAGEPGEVTRKIQETYFAAIRGEVDTYKGWLEHVRS